MLITVQGTTPKIFFQRRPALHGADGDVGLLHPAVDHRAELRHLQQRFGGNAVGGDVALGSLRASPARGRIVVLHARDAAEDFREIDRLDGDAVRFQNLLAVANGVERRGPRADRADAQPAQAVRPRGRRRRTSRDPCGTVRNPALRCAASSASTECRTASGYCRPTSCRRSCRGGRDRHLARRVRRRLDQHRHVQVGQAQAYRRWRARRRNSAA